MTDYADLISQLRKYSKRLLPCTHAAADALEAQARRVAELQAALKPFADAITDYEKSYKNIATPNDFVTGVTLGDLRAACAVYLGDKK